MDNNVNDDILSQKAVKIKDGVYYTGAFDPDLRVFDIVVPTANGTSYNSYFIQGSEKSALIDTVKLNTKDQLINPIKPLKKSIGIAEGVPPPKYMLFMRAFSE